MSYNTLLSFCGIYKNNSLFMLHVYITIHHYIPHIFIGEITREDMRRILHRWPTSGKYNWLVFWFSFSMSRDWCVYWVYGFDINKTFVVKTVYIHQLRDLSIKQLAFCSMTQLVTANTVNTVCMESMRNVISQMMPFFFWHWSLNLVKWSLIWKMQSVL